MTNMTGSNCPYLVIGLLQDPFHIEAHIGSGQYGPRLRLRPIQVSLFQMSEVCNKQFNTWEFPYWPGYHPSTHIGPQLHLGPIWGSQDDNQANMEMSMYKSVNIVPRNISYCTRKLVQNDILLGTIFTNIHAITL